MMMDFILEPLNLVTFFPLLGVLILLFLKKDQKEAARWIALVASLVTFGISLWVLAQFNSAETGLQMEVNALWFTFGEWEIKYALGVDGLSILLLLTRFVPVLRILGVHPGTNVFPDRDLGWEPAHVRGNQVLSLHHGGFDTDAACDPVAGQYPRDFLCTRSGCDGWYPG
jgi:hypothetical protein